METNVMNVSAKASRENLWTLLSQYTICIPRIQRDYAQGRTEPEPTQIRKTFLKDIFNALKNDTKMDVNFIYGNIDVDGKKFIPIDGQQRLTTLFLLHWYFASWSGKLDAGNIEILKRFNYETRFDTGGFCERLVTDVKVDLKKLVKTGRKLTDVVRDYYWYFSAYDHDATIRGMLIMLQEIHNTVKNLPDTTIVDKFFEALIDPDGPISFLFMDIKNIGLTDEIYIKMNARGKALTRFENFKARLSSYLAKNDEAFSREFIRNINGTWSQFFWHEEYRPVVEDKENKSNPKKATIFDDQMMNLFRFIMMNEFIENVEIDDSDSTEMKYQIRGMLKALDDENDSQFMNHLFSDEFRSVPGDKAGKPNVDIRVFRFLNRLLNILAKRKQDTGSIIFSDKALYGKEYLNEESYFKRLIRSFGTSLTYDESILLYAEFCFLEKYASADCTFDKTKELTEWLRFVHNLSKNTLYNGFDDYLRSIRRVRNIVDNGLALDILNYSATLLRRDYKQGSGYGFVENQVMEECIKANLILKGQEWRKTIAEAEKSFLGSQIAAILSFSGIWEIYESEMNDYEVQNKDSKKLPGADSILKKLVTDNAFIDSFKLYLRKFNLIFDKEALKPELETDSLLRRALLTFGGADSYMLPANRPVCCFLDTTDRDTSFRRLFRGDSLKNRGYFKELLDAINSGSDVKLQLQNIIKGIKYDNDNRWKRYFIEMPEILECMSQNKNSTDPAGKFVFKNAKRFIRKNSVDDILLLEKTKTSSINREYYSYVLYLKAKANDLDVDYYTTYGDVNKKYLSYTNNQDQEVQVIYTKDETDPVNSYMFMAKDSGNILYKSALDNMLDYIKQSIKQNSVPNNERL